jgi:hypothetical protein
MKGKGEVKVYVLDFSKSKKSLSFRSLFKLDLNSRSGMNKSADRLQNIKKEFIEEDKVEDIENHASSAKIESPKFQFEPPSKVSFYHQGGSRALSEQRQKSERADLSFRSQKR